MNLRFLQNIRIFFLRACAVSLCIGPLLAAPVRKKYAPKPCAYQLSSTADCTPCNLRQWAKKINTLKERPIEFSSLPTKKAYQKNILTLTEFLSTIQKCAHVVADTCKDDALWLHKKSLHSAAPDIFNLERPCTDPVDTPANFVFKPYTCRLLAQPGSVFALFGDLHGSVHSLMRDLLKLRDLGYLADDFKIKKNNFHLVFLGDYIDRGIYGAEVMYTLARLKIANPTRVILVRGNHEDYILAPDFRKKHTKQEEKDNAPSFIDELHLKFDLSQKHEVAIFRFYEVLPQALYLGCQANNHRDFMMCCHGGLELGYDPGPFLKADASVQFELIETLLRKKHFNQKLTHQLQNDIKTHFDLDTLCGDIQDFTPRAPFYKTTPNHTAYIGFMWNDFYVDPLKTVGQRSKKFTGWVYGKNLTQAVLKWGSSEKVTLHGILRAHQHNNDTGGPMLNLLCCTKGIVDVWKDKHVYTLLSAPDSKLEDTGEECFTYDSFVLLTTAAKFDQWRLVHYTHDQGKAWTHQGRALDPPGRALDPQCSRY